jgi:hypothetical protein
VPQLFGTLGGGVYGFQRPTIEVAWKTALAGFIGLGALATCDLLYARHTKARFFALHVICNLWISLLCVPVRDFGFHLSTALDDFSLFF